MRGGKVKAVKKMGKVEGVYQDSLDFYPDSLDLW